MLIKFALAPVMTIARLDKQIAQKNFCQLLNGLKLNLVLRRLLIRKLGKTRKTEQAEKK